MSSISKPDHCMERPSPVLLSAYQEYLVTFKLITSQMEQRARPLITRIIPTFLCRWCISLSPSKRHGRLAWCVTEWQMGFRCHATRFVSRAVNNIIRRTGLFSVQCHLVMVFLLTPSRSTIETQLPRLAFQNLFWFPIFEMCCPPASFFQSRDSVYRWTVKIKTRTINLFSM